MHRNTMVKHFVRQPLSSGFMITSLVGFMISTLWVWSKNMDWGFTLTFFFGLMIIASVYNFTHAEGEDHLDIHNSKYYLKQ